MADIFNLLFISPFASTSPGLPLMQELLLQLLQTSGMTYQTLYTIQRHLVLLNKTAKLNIKQKVDKAQIRRIPKWSNDLYFHH